LRVHALTGVPQSQSKRHSVLAHYHTTLKVIASAASHTILAYVGATPLLSCPPVLTLQGRKVGLIPCSPHWHPSSTSPPDYPQFYSDWQYLRADPLDFDATVSYAAAHSQYRDTLHDFEPHDLSWPYTTQPYPAGWDPSAPRASRHLLAKDDSRA
jgi:hypothetical protein